MSTILVLEDDRELNQTMTYALEKEGYHVLSAYSCEEAKELSKQRTLHLAILDVNLPDGDGFQFCSWLKAGKIFSERMLHEFECPLRLFPSGTKSKDHHFIILRKLVI